MPHIFQPLNSTIEHESSNGAISRSHCHVDLADRCYSDHAVDGSPEDRCQAADSRHDASLTLMCTRVLAVDTVRFVEALSKCVPASH
jgi:hypothetical protein